MYKNLRRFICVALTSVLIASSCKKADSNIIEPVTPGNTGTDSLGNIIAPAGFNYTTTKDVTFSITVLAPDNTPIANIPINILDKAADIGGTILFTALTGSDGKISGTVKLPAYMDAAVVDPAYTGIMRNAAVSIVNNTLAGTIGGNAGYAGNVIPNSPLSGRVALGVSGTTLRPMFFYSYIGTYDSQGKPNYLEPVNQVISNTLLTNLNASLPEGRAVSIYHPTYLLQNVETNLNIASASDVYFTFVSEGAGFRNSIAYFTYPTGTPPQNTSQIDSLHIILPNASLNGSGGSLLSGNTIRLGRFAAGTSIGFALLANAWTGTAVGSGYWINYTVDQLNPAAAPALKRQSVLLYDIVQDLFLVGFEDIRRDLSSCDNDFNDCVFYVKSQQVHAISTAGVNPVDVPVDTDHDGVNDLYDAFPTDPTRAYLNYYPSKTTMGTIAFEDNWPFKGDYDFNDLVVKYRYTVTSDALNRAVEMTAGYILQASGAAQKNGFGVELPFAPSLITSATGSLVTNTQVVTLSSNGTETRQAKAVIIPFDDAFAAMNASEGFNTYVGSPFLTRDTVKMNIKFTRPLLQAELGLAPYNPFIIINRTRGREAHLAGYAPTALVDTKFFKTGLDNTNPSTSNYYKTTNNLPWGIAFADNFNYPAELKAINTGYTKFVPWVLSSGQSFTNWYTDSANTVKSLIYHR